MNDTRNPAFDPRIAEWLEDDPGDAPPAVLNTVLAAIPSIPQRRGLFAPRRTPPMIRIAAFAAAALLVVAGGVLLLGGRGQVPAPSPTPVATTAAQATPSPTGTIVDRTAAGYLLALPASWHWSENRGLLYLSAPDPIKRADVWEGHLLPGATPADYEIPQNDGQQPLRGRTVRELLDSDNQWYLTYASSKADNERSTTVDGEPALVVEHSLTGPAMLSIDAIVIHGNFAYNIVLNAPPGDATTLRTEFERFLSRITWVR